MSKYIPKHTTIKKDFEPDEDDLCFCGHFYGEHDVFNYPFGCLSDRDVEGHLVPCLCEKFDYDMMGTFSNDCAEDATWD